MSKGGAHETPLFRCNSRHSTNLIVLPHKKIRLVWYVYYRMQSRVRTDIFFKGNANYAAITAICAANIVLIAYIVVSVMEDKQSFKDAEEKKLSETKKER
jgi:hypothetical protein